MQWDHRQRPILPAGTVIRFRNPGLKKNPPDSDPPRHYLIEEELGQGRLCVYKVRPMLPKVELPEVELPEIELPEVELPEVEKRKRTETTESERREFDSIICVRGETYVWQSRFFLSVAEENPTENTTTAAVVATPSKTPKGKGGRFVKKSKRHVDPLASSPTSDLTRLRPVSLSVAPDVAPPTSSTSSYLTALQSISTARVDPPASTSSSTLIVLRSRRSVSTSFAAPVAPPTSSTSSYITTLESVSTTRVDPPAIDPPATDPPTTDPPAIDPPASSTISVPTPLRSVSAAVSATSAHAVGSTASEAGGWVPIGEFQAIKIAYIPGSQHRTFGSDKSYERLGQLGAEFDQAMQIAGAGESRIPSFILSW